MIPVGSGAAGAHGVVGVIRSRLEAIQNKWSHEQSGDTITSTVLSAEDMSHSRERVIAINIRCQVLIIMKNGSRHHIKIQAGILIPTPPRNTGPSHSEMDSGGILPQAI